MVLLQRKLYFWDPEGGPTFSSGGGGGPNTYFYRTPYNLWFSGGGGGGGGGGGESGPDKTYKHTHLQTGRLKETFMRMFRQTDV